MYVFSTHAKLQSVVELHSLFSVKHYFQDHVLSKWPQRRRVPESGYAGHAATAASHCPSPFSVFRHGGTPFSLPLESSATAAPLFPFPLESSATAATPLSLPFQPGLEARLSLASLLLLDAFFVNTHRGKWAPACISSPTSHSSLSSAFCRKRRYGQ
jgi:hypothetical protein